MGIKFGENGSKIIATITPIHASWKPIIVFDDGTEVTVYYGEYLHSHYKSYQKDVTDEAKAEIIATDVVDELAMVFDDKVGFWCAGSSSGMGPIEQHGTEAWGHAGLPLVLWSGTTIP